MRFPHATGLILILWVILSVDSTVASQNESFLPENLEVITAENIGRLEQLTVLGRGLIQGIEWSPDGSTIAVQTAVGTWLYNPVDLSETPQFIGTADYLVFGPDWTVVAARSWDGNAIDLWNLETGEVESQLLSPYDSPMEPILFSSNGQYLVVRSDSRDARLIVWDVIHEVPAFIDADVSYFYSESVAFSPDSRRLVYVDSIDVDGIGHLVDLQTGQVIELPGHGNSIHKTTFDSTGDSVLIKGEDGIRQWDTQSGEFLGMPLPIFDDIPGAALSGMRIAVS